MSKIINTGDEQEATIPVSVCLSSAFGYKYNRERIRRANDDGDGERGQK